MEPSVPSGRLFLGGEGWESGPALEELVGLSGGPEARVVVVAIAGRDPVDRIGGWRERFEGLGVVDVRGAEARAPEDLDRARLVALVERAALVLLDGDDPARLAAIAFETRFDAAIRRRLEVGGMTLAGSGALATALGERMVAGEDRPDEAEIETGLGYRPGLAFDPEFAADSGLHRLRRALAGRTDLIGLGVEAGSALMVQGPTIALIGEGRGVALAWISDAGAPIPQPITPDQPFRVRPIGPIPPSRGVDGVG